MLVNSKYKGPTGAKGGGVQRLADMAAETFFFMTPSLIITELICLLDWVSILHAPREHVKKLAFVADAFAKALTFTPPPPRIRILCIFFPIDICIFETRKVKLRILKEEKVHRKYFQRIPSSQNIFAYSFVSDHSKHFFYFEKKKLAAGEGPPPISGRVR